MTQDYELVVKGVRNFENKVTVTVALQDKERFDGEIFDPMSPWTVLKELRWSFMRQQPEGASGKSSRSSRKLSEKVESYLQHQYSFKIENPANKHERPHHKYI